MNMAIRGVNVNKSQSEIMPKKKRHSNLFNMSKEKERTPCILMNHRPLTQYFKYKVNEQNAIWMLKM